MTQISRERREDIEKWLDGYNLPPASIDEMRALLADSAWRERVERKLTELAHEWEHEGVYPDYQEAKRDCASDVRAIVDTGDEEGE